MKVTVLCFGMLRDHLPSTADGNRALVDLEGQATVADVVGSLGLPEGQVFAILVDGERGDLGQRLQEGSEVTLMPPFSGG